MTVFPDMCDISYRHYYVGNKCCDAEYGNPDDEAEVELTCNGVEICVEKIVKPEDYCPDAYRKSPGGEIVGQLP